MTSREVHHATHPDQNAAGNIKHLLGTSLLETLQALPSGSFLAEQLGDLRGEGHRPNLHTHHP